MDDIFSLTPVERQKQYEIAELKKCNDYTIKFGLCLSDKQITTLIEKRFDSLKSMGRIEFGEGIIKKLIYNFLWFTVHFARELWRYYMWIARNFLLF